MTDRLESRLEDLRAADANWGAAHLDPDEDRRIRARLASPAARRWRPFAAFGALAAAAAAAVVLWPAPVPPCAPGPAAEACLIHHDASAIYVQPGGDVTTGADGVEVHAGRARFTVEPRAEQAYAVTAAGARIEVLGTTFDVAVADDTGRVELIEGRIRLTTPDGRVRTLAPGEGATWSSTVARTGPRTAPSPVAPPPLVAPTQPTPSTAAPRSGSPSSVEPAPPPPRRLRPARPNPRPPARTEPSPYALARVQALRDAGDFEGAITQIDALLRRFPRASTAEALSLERIDLLDSALMDRERACHHLRLHLRRFADSPLSPTARASARRLRCSDGIADPRTP